MIGHLFISSSQQRLYFFQNGVCKKSYAISTAKNGLGEIAGSYCTPRGWHEVADIIGFGMPINTVFKARQPTGQIYSPDLAQELPEQDWILSRIIRFKGCEIGFNRGGHVDSYERFIYIHGCAAEHLLGQPASHGCIRMNNQDIIQLANLLTVGDSLFIA